MVTLFIFLLENSSAAFILWLGIFIITRTLSKIDEPFYWPESPPLFAGIATTLLAIYLFGVAMQAIVHTPAEFVLWQKLTWCTTPVAILAFFWSTLLLVFQLQIGALSLWQRLLCTALGLYALFLIIGIATGFFMQYTAIQPQTTPFQTFYASARLPHFYNLFVAVLLISCVTLFLRQWWRALQINADEYQRYKWLGYGSLCLLVGALQNDKILADSPLQNLVVVQQALLRHTQKQRLDDALLTTGQRAHILRHFLIDLLEQQGAGMPTAKGTQPQCTYSHSSCTYFSRMRRIVKTT